MTGAEFLATVVDPGLAMLPLTLRSDTARCLLVAIAGQESGWRARQQAGAGPAHGFYQCEGAPGSALAGVFRNETFRPILEAACRQAYIPLDVATLYVAITWHDAIATVVARLILLADLAPLPTIGDMSGAWRYYLRTWRPGKPRPDDWPLYYRPAQALFLPPPIAD